MRCNEFHWYNVISLLKIFYAAYGHVFCVEGVIIWSMSCRITAFRERIFGSNFKFFRRLFPLQFINQTLSGFFLLLWVKFLRGSVNTIISSSFSSSFFLMERKLIRNKQMPKLHSGGRTAIDLSTLFLTWFTLKQDVAGNLCFLLFRSSRNLGQIDRERNTPFIHQNLPSQLLYFPRQTCSSNLPGSTKSLPFGDEST